MSTAAAITEITQGTRVRFRDADYDPDLGNCHVGIVNDQPFLTFQESNGKLFAWVPVHEQDGNRITVVAGANIVGVET